MQEAGRGLHASDVGRVGVKILVKCYASRIRIRDVFHSVTNLSSIDSPTARIVPRADHTISRQRISKHALTVLYRLKDAGFRACLVGGGVRDLLLGREPKDFDVVTDARPEEVRALFRNCRLVGRRFRLAHVYFREDVVEVSTFRGGHDGEDDAGKVAEDGRILRDNVYGTLEEDVWRRDFSVNALYYDIEDFSLIDYADGLADLEAGRLRMLGDAEARYHEDPVRMLRAVRFAAKLGFRMDEATETPLFHLGELLEPIPAARLYEEVLKLFQSGHGAASFELLRHYDLLRRLLPAVDAQLCRDRDEGRVHKLVRLALESTDQRVAEGLPVNPAFLFAALLWEPVRAAYERNMAEHEPWSDALRHAADEVLDAVVRRVAIPKRVTLMIRDIWFLQPRFSQRGGRREAGLGAHERFRAGVDFLCLRAESGEPLRGDCDYWREIEESVPSRTHAHTHAPAHEGGERGRKPRRRSGFRRRPRGG